MRSPNAIASAPEQGCANTHGIEFVGILYRHLNCFSIAGAVLNHQTGNTGKDLVGAALIRDILILRIHHLMHYCTQTAQVIITDPVRHHGPAGRFLGSRSTLSILFCFGGGYRGSGGSNINQCISIPMSVDLIGSLYQRIRNRFILRPARCQQKRWNHAGHLIDIWQHSGNRCCNSIYTHCRQVDLSIGHRCGSHCTGQIADNHRRTVIICFHRIVSALGLSGQCDCTKDRFVVGNLCLAICKGQRRRSIARCPVLRRVKHIDHNNGTNRINTHKMRKHRLGKAVIVPQEAVSDLTHSLRCTVQKNRHIGFPLIVFELVDRCYAEVDRQGAAHLGGHRITSYSLGINAMLITHLDPPKL